MPASALRRAATAAFATAAVSAGLVLGTGTASASLSPEQLRSVTDSYLFSKSLEQFTTIKGQKPYSDQLDWSTDHCSWSPDRPVGFDFTPGCDRHDFGYRNDKKQGRFTEANRKKIDDNLKADLYHICKGNWGCKRIADIYYAAVRKFGGGGTQSAAAETAYLRTELAKPENQPALAAAAAR